MRRDAGAGVRARLVASVSIIGGMQSHPPTLWYEDHEGRRWVPPQGGSLVDPPHGFCFMRVREVAMHETVHQLAAVADPDGEQSETRLLMRGTATYSPGLVLALVRPTLRERLRSLCRGYLRAPRHGLREAQLIAAVACERCANELAHRAGAAWGYRKGSDEWLRAGTRCELCRPKCYVEAS